MQERHEVSVEGERVVAVHHDAPTDDWLFFCHGFQSDKSGSYESRCERAVTEGYNGVRFDFRGCGESDRAFHEQTLSSRIADLRAVVEHFDPGSYVVFGSSFGGKVAFHASDDAEAIATRAPVTDNRVFDDLRAAVVGDAATPTEGSEEIPPGDWTGFFEDLDRYPFAEAVAEVSVPVAIFHGRGDETVPLAHSIEATGELDGDVLLQTYAEEGHRFSREAEARLQDQLFDWLDSLDQR
jgi:pimeloyl-ACP methyl ester carboxylesterase